MPAWALVAGVLLLSSVLSGTWTGRPPPSSAVTCLRCGVFLGPGALGMLAPGAVHDAALIDVACGAALPISRFSVGLDMGGPLMDRRWSLPALPALVSMVATIAIVPVVGHVWLQLPLGAAVLPGAIRAPTDPVPASGLHADTEGRPGRVGFARSGEGGTNDGLAFPFVVPGRSLMGDAGEGLSWARWFWADRVWSPIAGLAIGGALGAVTGRLLVYLRSRHRQAVGLDMFLGLGLMALAYGTAQLAIVSRFLAVLATGPALRPGPSRHDHPALSVLPVLAGQRLTAAQGGLMAWFSIRGIGSVYYLALVLRSDIDSVSRVTLTSPTLWTVTASIVATG